MEGEDILFSEIQKFQQRWVWIIIITVNLFLLYAVYKQIIMGEKWGIKPMGNTGLIISTLAALAVAVLFYKARLETIIKKDGIFVRFFPLFFSTKEYAWKSLSKCHIRSYSALAEFGGWGWRFSVFGRGTAYTIKGDKGLQLILKSGRKLLIGTQKPKELEAALQKIDQIKP